MLTTTADLTQPPPYRYTGPIIDAHCHNGKIPATRRMFKAGARYGVKRWVAICRIQQVDELRKHFGERIAFSIWIDHSHLDNADAFVETNLNIIDQAVRKGCHSIKFWYKPEFNHRSDIYFDDPRLDPIFRAMADNSLPALVHIADPDVWWKSHYHDPERFETKKFTYRQLTNTLRRFPSVRVQVAHMGGWPENLTFLSRLLDSHPNCYLDTSATKWIARELSAQPAAARTFIIRYIDRLMFGSDLVAFKQATLEHHCSRYFVHRHLYEHASSLPSPIPDPDANGQVHVAGLDLPDAVLHKLYYQNAQRFFRLDTP